MIWIVKSSNPKHLFKTSNITRGFSTGHWPGIRLDAKYSTQSISLKRLAGTADAAAAGPSIQTSKRRVCNGDGQGWRNNQWGESPLGKTLFFFLSFFLSLSARSYLSLIVFLLPPPNKTHVRTSRFFYKLLLWFFLLLSFPTAPPLSRRPWSSTCSSFWGRFKRFIHLAAATISGSLLRIASTGASVFQQLLSLSLSLGPRHSRLSPAIPPCWFHHSIWLIIFLPSKRSRRTWATTTTTPSCLKLHSDPSNHLTVPH